MATISKTAAQTLLALQSIASNTVVISNALSVTSKLAAMVLIRFGRRATTALTAGMTFRVEVSAKDSGDGFWWPVAQFLTDTATAESESVTASTAGSNVISVASTTNLAAGDIIYIDNGTIANSEWGRIKSISANVSVTIEDNLNNDQDSSVIYDQAQFFQCQVDLTAITRLRLVCDGSGTGQAVAVEAWAITGDSIG